MSDSQVYAYGYLTLITLAVFIPIVVKAVKDCSKPMKEPMARFNKR